MSPQAQMSALQQRTAELQGQIDKLAKENQTLADQNTKMQEEMSYLSGIAVEY